VRSCIVSILIKFTSSIFTYAVVGLVGECPAALQSGAGNPSVLGSTQTTSLRYFHRDQLGSVAAVTDSLVGRTTDRGFTEHEHLDEIGVVHMNGRIYDPLVGRFMSADPFIQAPGMLQSYNRYAYVMNNPLNLTDPSGYFSLRGFLRNLDTFARNPSTTNAFNAHRSVPGVVSLDNFVVKHPWAFHLGRAAAGAWGGPWAAAGATGYYTYLTTGCESCSVKAFGLSLGTAYAFDAAGTSAQGSEYGVGHYASHAAVGCVSSVAGGGQCGAGALSAVAGLAGTQIGGAIGAGTAGRFASAVIAGGIGSRLAGGSFMDGAQTAAYGYLFNCLAHKCNAADYDMNDPRSHMSPAQASPELCAASASGCMDAARRVIGCASAPGQPGCTAVGQEREIRLTSPPGVDNVITQYRPNSDMIINGTSPSHMLHDGYVVRWLAVNAAGNVQIWTAGIGTNSGRFMSYLNQSLGSQLFYTIGHDNAQQVRYCMKYGCK
jgi:RHS repeat-associated protein